MTIGVVSPQSARTHLVERVESALRESGRFDLQLVRVVSSDRRVRLTGIVGSYFMKQLAQSIALSTDGVVHVANDLDVRCL